MSLLVLTSLLMAGVPDGGVPVARALATELAAGKSVLVSARQRRRLHRVFASRVEGTEYLDCGESSGDYAGPMDWQELAALMIVVIAFSIFVWRLARPRQFGFQRDSKCGCSSAGVTSSGSSILYRARKGERPQVVVKMK